MDNLFDLRVGYVPIIQYQIGNGRRPQQADRQTKKEKGIEIGPKGSFRGYCVEE